MKDLQFIAEANNIDLDTALEKSIGLLNYFTEVEQSGGRILKKGRIFTRQVFITSKKK